MEPSVNVLAFQTAKLWGWSAVAIAVGSLFGTFSPCITGRPSNPELGRSAGVALGLMALGIQVYSLGAAALLPILGYVVMGSLLLGLTKVVAEYALNRFFSEKGLI